MKILGIETATEVCAVALFHDWNIVSEIAKEEKYIHAEKLLPMIHQLLSSCKVELSELDAIAVSIGPGSFTGLRIGLSVAKGLSYSSNLPLVAVSTLKACAVSTLQKFPTTTSILVPIIEIQKNEFVLTTFRKETLFDTNDFELRSFTKDSSASAIELFNQQYENYVLCGHGSENFCEMFVKQHNFPNVSLVEKKELLKCNAQSIAFLGAMQLEKNDIAELDALEPTYGKDFIAKKSSLFERIAQ